MEFNILFNIIGTWHSINTIIKSSKGQFDFSEEDDDEEAKPKKNQNSDSQNIINQKDNNKDNKTENPKENKNNVISSKNSKIIKKIKYVHKILY